MIIWVASYPRSGNTLTFMTLNRCFGVKSYSIYDTFPLGEARVAGPLGHAPDVDEFLRQARASPDLFLVKTHLLPPDEDDPAIYVVRDGRAAMLSHRRYLKDTASLRLPIGYIALGAPPIIGWGDHVLAWMRRPAERLLVLHYEEMVTADDALLARISQFIGRPVVHGFDIKFEDLHARNPGFFRVGHNGPGIAQIERQCPDLFWAVNGESMRRAGYETPEPPPAPISESVRADLRRAMTATRALAVRENADSDWPG